MVRKKKKEKNREDADKRGRAKGQVLRVGFFQNERIKEEKEAPDLTSTHKCFNVELVQHHSVCMLVQVCVGEVGWGGGYMCSNCVTCVYTSVCAFMWHHCFFCTLCNVKYEIK